MAKGNKLADRFTPADDSTTHRTIASLEGEVGTGKTHFALTAPSPTLVQNLDLGTEGVIEQFRKDGKEIYDEKYIWRPHDIDDEDSDVKPDDLQNMAIEIRDKWEKDFRYGVKNGIRTSIWDTESRIWQVYRYAAFGAPNGADIRDYDELNQRFEANINLAKEHNINMFLIRSMKDKWGSYGAVKANGKKSFAKGGREVWGYEHLAGQMFMELRFLYDPELEHELGSPYAIEIGKCRHNYKMQWTKVARCEFAELGTQLIEDSTEEDWL